MAKVTVFFPVYPEYTVQVEVEDPADYEQMDEALDRAYELLPSGVCAQCSGWGEKWSFDLSVMDLEAKYAEDEDGNVVWGERPGMPPVQ